MALNIGNISNNHKTSKLENQTKYDSTYFAAQKPMEKDKFEKSSNGQFDASEAGKNFVKGLISPITEMFSSVKNFAMGAGMLAGSTALIIATGGAVAPILLAAGVTVGAFQAGSGILKIVKAKNGDDAEKAFFDIGGATSTLGLSAWGAKPTLRQAGINTKGMNPLSAIQKSFTSAKDLIVESFNVFKSGYFKYNVKNFMQTLQTPKEIKKYSKQLFKEGEKAFEETFSALKKGLPDELQAKLKGRIKCEQSIREKIMKEYTVNINKKIESVKNDASLSPSQKREKLMLLSAEKESIRTNAEFAKRKVGDLIGARLTLDDVSHSAMNKIVNSLSSAVKKGEIEILEIENYRGSNPRYGVENDFYLTNSQAQKLANISGKTKYVAETKSSGYTAVHMTIKPKGQKPVELQIRGKEVDRFADIEHIPYDLKNQKDISKNNNQIGILLTKTQKAIKSLTQEQFEQYQKYFCEYYSYAQKTEKGIATKQPKLPSGIDESLSAESLESLYSQITKIETGVVKNHMKVYSQFVTLGAFNS